MVDTPARHDWGADRYVPFIRTCAFAPYDFTGATFAMQVRDRANGGTIRADLGTVVSASAEGVMLVYGGTDTVANHITAGRLTQAQADAKNYAAADNLALSVLGIRINETTMEAIPLASHPENDVTLYWDLHITPTSGTKEKYAGGIFTVRAGVTQ